MVRPCPLYLYTISPVVSTPAVRIVFAVASLVFSSSKAEVVSRRRALLDVVSIAMMRELDQDKYRAGRNLYGEEKYSPQRYQC